MHWTVCVNKSDNAEKVKSISNLKHKSMRYSILSIALSAFLFCGCGNNKEESKTEKSEPTPQVEAAPAPASEATSVTLELESNDQMKFNKSELKVKAGQKVTLNLTHTGQMAKDVMGHNFVLLKPGTDLADFGMLAMNAKETEYIPESDAIITHTKLIGGGESTSITFDAPEKGTYEFICSFPGHYAMMKGTFIVE